MKMTYVVCKNDTPISAIDNEDWAKTEVERLKKVISNIERQLWRYYNVEIEIEKIYRDTYNGVEFFYINGNSEKGRTSYSIKCKIYDSGTVEDLYLWDGGWIEPTTTAEEQEYR